MNIIFGRLPPKMTDDRFVCMDIETFGQTEGKLHRPNGEFACVSVCIEGTEDVYLIEDEVIIPELLKRLESGTWVFHNAMYDLSQLRRYAIVEPRFIWDTMLVSQSMYGGYYQHHGLKHLVRRDLKKVMLKEERKEFSTGSSMTDSMKEYAALDALYTLEIAVKQREKFSGDPAFQAYLKADEPLIFPLLDMKGVKVDAEKWSKMVSVFEERGIELERQLGCNSMSYKQVKLLLASKGFHLDSTGADVLEEIAGDCPEAQLILDARMYRKAVSTYGQSWLESHVEEDGRVYSSFNIIGALTGRMSSNSPNVQQIPSRKIPEYRELFIPEGGKIFGVWDVSQQEPCITAFESKDAELLRAVNDGEDLHLTAAKGAFMDDSLTKEKNKDERSVGKAINLGLVYGLTKYGLDRKLNCGLDKAQEFLDRYFMRFNGVRRWIDYTQHRAKVAGYVSTSLGRKIYINMNSKSGPNNAINSPIQGGAADFMKIWVRKIWEKCNERGLSYPLVLIVHDEIVQEMDPAYKEDYDKIVQESVQETGELLYPGIKFRLDGGFGESWAVK